MESVIVLQDLSKQYGDYKAVKQLNLTIRKGEVFGLLGPNGAGKTTTILMLLGLTERTEGQIQVLGLDPLFDALKIKKLVGYMPDDVGFYDDRSALENLVYTAMLNGIAKDEAKSTAMALLKRVGLEEVSAKQVSTFSRGMRQRLGLADVLIKQPEIIILDEPTLGIDPEGVREFLQLISQLSKEENITVLLSSHHLQQVQQVCDRVGLFVNGQLLACGHIDELARELNIKEGLNVQLKCKLNDVFSFNKLLESSPKVKRYEYMKEEQDIDKYTVYCNDACTSELARLAVENGELLMIHEHKHNLDDIYHRYFAGGGTHE